MSIEGRIVLPFKRGTSTAQDLSALIGNEYSAVDKDYLTNREIRLRLVKNGSTLALAPKKCVRFQKSGTYQTVVDGYTAVNAEVIAGVVDDQIPSGSTVAVSSYFYVVVNGPSLCLTADTAASNVNNVAVGDKVVAATAAASTQTTDAGAVAGRALGVTYTGAADQIENALGRAATARGTTVTATDILVILRSF